MAERPENLDKWVGLSVYHYPPAGPIADYAVAVEDERDQARARLAECEAALREKDKQIARARRLVNAALPVGERIIALRAALAARGGEHG